jgi:hypothetical protein
MNQGDIHVVSTSRKTPATTHISRLASDFVIQMVNPYDLRAACEISTDYGEDHHTDEDGYTVLLQRKYDNCTEWFLRDLESIGVQEPLVVIIRPDGRWQFDDGHHRLAWALLNNVDIPVVFDKMGADEDVLDNVTCYQVARPDFNVRSNATEADVLISETESYLTNVADAQTDEFAVVIPSPRGQHRSKAKVGGKHRAT